MRTIETITADVFAQRLTTAPLPVVDVRKPGEHIAEHVKGAANYPLDYIEQHFGNLSKSQPYFVHCAGGYRSMIAASILTNEGYQVVDVAGGFAAIKKTDVPVTDYVCPTTLA